MELNTIRARKVPSQTTTITPIEPTDTTAAAPLNTSNNQSGGRPFVKDSNDLDSSAHIPAAFPQDTPTLSYYFFPSTAFGSNMLIESASGESLYYCDCSEWTAAPDVVLHEGAEKTKGRVVAGAEFRWSSTLRMLLGSGAAGKGKYAKDGGEEEVVEMRLEAKWSHGKYSMIIRGGGGAGGDPSDLLTRIEWKRTRMQEHGCEGIARFSQNNFAITDVDSQQLLGVTVRSPKFSMRRKGKLVVRADVPENVRLYLLLGAVGLTEKARRRDARWQSGGS